MNTTTQWIGRIMKILTILFLGFDSIIHILNTPEVSQSFIDLGYNPTLALPLGLLELGLLLLYSIPQTAVLGALFLTGYLGGAVATHVIAQNGLFGFILFPVYVGVILWGALFLLNPSLRSSMFKRTTHEIIQ